MLFLLNFNFVEFKKIFLVVVSVKRESIGCNERILIDIVISLILEISDCFKVSIMLLKNEYN